MQKHYLAIALAGFAGISINAHADSLSEWGYWDSAPAQNMQVQPDSVIRVPGESTARNRQQPNRNANVAAVSVGNLPNTLIQDVGLTSPGGGTPSPNRWFGYAALESGTPTGAYDTNAYLETDSSWTYGAIPQTFTFRIAGEDMVTTTMGTPSSYGNWDYYGSGSSYVHVNDKIPMPTDVPMTIGHWHKGGQTYYTLVGTVTQPIDMQALATGPSITYGGQSMGGSGVSISVNFSNASWNGTWTAGQFSPHMSGSATTTPSFTATGTVSGSNIQSTSISGVTNLDAANSFVKGTFYGNGAAALGGLTVIKTDTAQHSDLFVVCKGLSSCAPL